MTSSIIPPIKVMCEVITNPVLQLRKLRLKGVEYFAQRHTLVSRRKRLSPGESNLVLASPPSPAVQFVGGAVLPQEPFGHACRPFQTFLAATAGVRRFYWHLCVEGGDACLTPPSAQEAPHKLTQAQMSITSRLRNPVLLGKDKQRKYLNSQFFVFTSLLQPDTK